MTGLPNFYFLRTLRLTPPWHWHTTRHLSCPLGTFVAYTWPSFPNLNTAKHSSWSSSQTLVLKPPLPSQWPTISFSPLFIPDNLPFWGKFSLILLRILHLLSLGFSPFCDIGDLLCVVYNLSHPNIITVCHLPAFLGDIGFDSFVLLILIPYLPLYFYVLGQLDTLHLQSPGIYLINFS